MQGTSGLHGNTIYPAHSSKTSSSSYQTAGGTFSKRLRQLVGSLLCIGGTCAGPSAEAAAQVRETVPPVTARDKETDRELAPPPRPRSSPTNTLDRLFAASPTQPETIEQAAKIIPLLKEYKEELKSGKQHTLLELERAKNFIISKSFFSAHVYLKSDTTDKVGGLMSWVGSKPIVSYTKTDQIDQQLLVLECTSEHSQAQSLPLIRHNLLPTCVLH